MRGFRLKVLLLSTILLALLVAGCSQQGKQQPQAGLMPDTRAADEAAIRANTIAWNNVAQARDLTKVMTFYADDAIWLSNHGPIFKGKDEIQKGWQELFTNLASGVTFEATAVTAARFGDIAYSYGPYERVILEKKGKKSAEKGKYVLVWKKQADGSWKTVVDIDNTDM